MSWSPLALALALEYEHIFQPLQYFEPGIVIADVHVPSLKEACVWLDAYVRQNPDCGAVIIDVGLFDAGLMVSVFPDIPEVDRRMSDIRHKSVIVI
ncbi:hypothetical protein [Rhodovulum visakhapatnamense]|uniref:Uncharacterized protein n=1 Tax=Rhodovulum visakhapatnamense TaxID=364297 RepID=A0A4R8FBS8_9RHOB|nr:hypothetical protein [Rhodovulum visakhapatnamense]TDX21108.1 hypothetical protein EV657_1464 [Rhodovulum visakhapatnamense]